VTRPILRRAAPLAAAALVLAACGSAAAPPAGAQQPAPAPAAVTPPAAAALPKPEQTVPPMDLGGQKVLILPVQATFGVESDRQRATDELVYALTERDTRTTWVRPEALRRSLQRTPGYAGDPAALPRDAFTHYGERSVADPLASVLRRYSALMDARLVLLPREVRWLEAPGGGGAVRVLAVLVDARSGRLVWYGEARGPEGPDAGPGAVAAAFAALAERMLVGDPQ
jgi:hypothetical protein